MSALITGGAKRIGRAITRALAERGTDVIIHYLRSEDEAEELAVELRELGVRAWTIGCDLAQTGSVEGLMTEAIAAAGKVDILINSASIFPESTLEAVTTEQIIENMNVNALSPFLLARDFARQGRSGSIVNLLDTRIHDYDRKHVAYHLSKRSFFALTRMMSVEFAPSIRVNAVAPGLVLPPSGEDEGYLRRMAHTNPLGTFGSVQDVANAVLFLLDSSFITGQIIYVDGGRHLKGSFYGA